jgi:hypothetical protein
MRAGSSLLLLTVLGCGSSSHTGISTAATTTVAPRVYFAPYVAGTTNASSGGGVPVPLAFPQTYTIDDVGGAFSQATYALLPPQQQGSQVINAGVLSSNARNLRSLGISANYVLNTDTNQYAAVTYTPPEAGSFAVELDGQAGGVVQLLGQPAAPLTAAAACPASSTPQTYLFLTIPAPLAQPSDSGTQFTWDPTSETAYGTVDISANGSTVNLANIAQHTLPSAGGAGSPAQPGGASATGACAPTFFGNTISLPGQLIVTAPGNGQTAPPQATLGIGPTGLLVENNFTPDSSGTQPGTSPALSYNNMLGAGTGAVGLPKTSAPLDTGALVGAQYLGFIHAVGAFTAGSSSGPAFSSHLASFGFSSVPSGCAALAPATATMLYGGDFPDDNPASGTGGFGNCDFAIDLGAQDAATAGLYPAAQVTVGATYAGNSTAVTYSFSAVAIAGKLGNQYAIFVLGTDTTQPWIVYLLQSN